MTGYEVLKQMRHAGKDKRCFIKWWRKENDFVDYELVDTFLANLKPDHEFAGFELLTLEQMWQELHRREPRRVTVGQRHGEKVIRWQHMAEDGTMREEIFPFAPKAVMTVFDGETRGDTMA
ncbi:MAG: hypothetical protein FDZ69_10955 [Deltaproteobacteria bacterium]|nr:MAG: hypothetical protein FDZ69_10955 [Deltaproteobacteria bacterium]